MKRVAQIELTRAQIRAVVRQASQQPALNALVPFIDDADKLRAALTPFLEDDSYSRSTLRALMVLASFPSGGDGRALTGVARELALSPSTTHRYAATWMALELLEQHPQTRLYRRPLGD